MLYFFNQYAGYGRGNINSAPYRQRSTIYHLRLELANYDYTQVLSEATIPVLLLQGEKDTAINREIEKLWPLFKENSLIRREWLKGAGHFANYDQPQAFYESVIKFIEEQASCPLSRAKQIKPGRKS